VTVVTKSLVTDLITRELVIVVLEPCKVVAANRGIDNAAINKGSRLVLIVMALPFYLNELLFITFCKL